MSRYSYPHPMVEETILERLSKLFCFVLFYYWSILELRFKPRKLTPGSMKPFWEALHLWYWLWALIHIVLYCFFNNQWALHRQFALIPYAVLPKCDCWCLGGLEVPPAPHMDVLGSKCIFFVIPNTLSLLITFAHERHPQHPTVKNQHCGGELCSEQSLWHHSRSCIPEVSALMAS